MTPSRPTVGFGTLAEMDTRFEENQVNPAEVWNKLAGVVPVKKSTNRSSDLKRIWKQIQSLTPVPAKPAVKPAKASQAPNVNNGGQEAHTARRGSKQAQVVELLRTLVGVTLERLWKPLAGSATRCAAS